MFQIDNPSASPTLPAVTAAGVPGYFTDGSPSTGVDPTIVPAEFLNMLMLELINLVSTSGLVPNKASNTQVAQAIRRLMQKTSVLTDVGASNVYAAVNTPALVAADLVSGMVQRVSILGANTGASTYAPDGLAAKPVLGSGLAPLQGGELPDKGIATLLYVLASNINAGNGAWVLLECTGGTQQVPNATQSQHAIPKGQADGLYAPIGSGGSKIQSISASVASNALTLSYNGGNLDFRSTTLTSGTPTQNVVVPPNSIIVPFGASLGTTSGQSATLLLLQVYSGGAVIPAVVNLAGGLQLDETNLISPTTISASATSASVIYSASAVATNSPYRIVGRIDITEATAGTWASAPSLVQGIGGQALASLSSFGYGQTLQDFSSSGRTLGATYFNTTAKPIFVTFVPSSTNTQTVTVSLQGATLMNPNSGGAAGLTTAISVSFMVPPGWSYSITLGIGGIAFWKEIR